MTITQSDREAAARMAVLPELRELILEGRCDDCLYVEIARDIRISEQERCARVAEDWTMDWTRESAHVPSDIAQSIRSTQ